MVARIPDAVASLVRVSTLIALALVGCSTPAIAQAPDLTGDAALKHPAGQLAVKAADLLVAGKADAVIALGTKASQAEWKQASTDDRKGMTAMMLRRAPALAGFADSIRKSGVLATMGNSAILRVELAKGDAAITYFELEGGAWRITNGPMVIAGAAEPANETRIEGADLVAHPIAALAIQYVELVQADKIEDAMRLASSEAQREWKAEPASERAASAAFRKKNLPAVAEFKSLLSSGAVLIIEDGERATLNVIRQEKRPTTPGTVEYTSTTFAIPFVLENGVWKLAQ